MNKIKTIRKFEGARMVAPVYLCQNRYYKVKNGRNISVVAETIETQSYDFVDKNNNRLEIIIGKNFRHDGASVPRALWTVAGITPFGPAEYGSRPHDLLYMTKGGKIVEKSAQKYLGYSFNYSIKYNKKNVIVTRKVADKLMQAGFRKYHSDYHADRAYRILRRFGQPHWGGPAPVIK